MLSNTKVDERLAGTNIERRQEFVPGKGKLLWGCTICGNEWLAVAGKIVNHQTGCPDCGRASSVASRRSTTSVFIAKASVKHNNKYDYSHVTYTNAATPVDIVCPTHGLFSQVPDSHLNGNGCSRCHFDSLRDTKDAFIEKARAIHGDKYSYEKFVYVQSLVKGIITCPTHGDFLQKPNTHISRQVGCPLCDHENRKGSYSLEYFEKNPDEKDKPGYLYVVRLHQGNQSFIKIGMAADVTKRLRYYYGMNRELLITIPGTLRGIYTLEQRLLITLKEYKYYPLVYFEGYTECIKDKQEVLTLLEELLVTPC